MLTLKQLKKDMQFNRELGGLIEVLKGIASSHFRHLQAKREYFRRFSRALNSLFQTVDLLKSNHPFLKKHEQKGDGSPEGERLIAREPSPKSCVMIITSDEGFLGELNSQVINTGLTHRRQGDTLIVLGERGAHALEEAGESFLYFPGIPEDIGYEQAYSLRDYFIQQYRKKKFGRVIIVYPKFISFSVQEVTVKQLLPYEGEAGSGKREAAQPAARNPQPEILVEPSEDSIIDYLIRIWMAQEIYNILWDSKLSELASRVIHLEGSSNVVRELNKKLQFSYFRTVHQLSDKNIREIVASRVSGKREAGNVATRYP